MFVLSFFGGMFRDVKLQIEETELHALLSAKRRLEAQVTELQTRGTELVQENRALVKLGEASVRTAIVLCEQRAKQAIVPEEGTRKFVVLKHREGQSSGVEFPEVDSHDEAHEFWSEKFWLDAARYLESKL